MWRLKIAEGNDPYLYSTNNFVGRQIWEYDPDAATPAERQEVEDARQCFKNNRREGVHPSGDLLMRMQVSLNRMKIKLSVFCCLIFCYSKVSGIRVLISCH